MTTDQSRELCELAEKLEFFAWKTVKDPLTLEEGKKLIEAARQLRLMAEVVEQRDDAIARATKEMLDHETTKKERDTLRAQVESLKKQCAQTKADSDYLILRTNTLPISFGEALKAQKK